jgi:hypothetical protein
MHLTKQPHLYGLRGSFKAALQLYYRACTVYIIVKQSSSSNFWGFRKPNSKDFGYEFYIMILLGLQRATKLG